VFEGTTQAYDQPAAWRTFQDSFKSDGSQRGPATADNVPAIEPNELKDLSLTIWLGVRDDFRNWLTWVAQETDPELCTGRGAAALANRDAAQGPDGVDFGRLTRTREQDEGTQPQRVSRLIGDSGEREP
jgi:hypothetical protein